MKREAQPGLSSAGEHALEQYETALREEEDLTPISIRNYLSDVRQFMAWCEAQWQEEQVQQSFTPTFVTTPLITRYRTYLQTALWLKPATVNRALMSLKRYFAWTTTTRRTPLDPAKKVKFVPQEATAPRHLTDDEEHALMAAANAAGTLRDQTIMIVLLHTGLRARELCTLTRQQVHLGTRSGTLRIIGKRNKVREVPLNATARIALRTYLATAPKDSMYVFPSEKTGSALTERALGHLIKKYAEQARLVDVSPHDLRHRFGYRMAETVPLHRLAQIMGHDSLNTTLLYIRGTKQDLQQAVEHIAWV